MEIPARITLPLELISYCLSSRSHHKSNSCFLTGQKHIRLPVVSPETSVLPNDPAKICWFWNKDLKVTLFTTAYIQRCKMNLCHSSAHSSLRHRQQLLSYFMFVEGQVEFNLRISVTLRGKNAFPAPFNQVRTIWAHPANDFQEEELKPDESYNYLRFPASSQKKKNNQKTPP